ncbi:MAG: tRNA (cytidine(34)-2'-O)-methyltransferase [Proteobacteria bacterium]|nr:tRNA (cytidine(34)-2'-O)-methyltransferase [Pseudomonadota bacterium]
MIAGHPEICLFQPEIPQNTGNIGRLCAATQCRMHLIRPFAFSTDDRNLRRAGLDYWPFLDLEIHDSLETLLERFDGNFAFFTTKASRFYTEIPSDTKLLIFGQETKGLPAWVHERWADKSWKIPMFHPGVRSLNIANSASIVLYHQLMQHLGLNSDHKKNDTTG